MKSAFLWLVHIFVVGQLAFSPQAEAKNHNVAVFGGGGVNAYASLYLAQLFYWHAKAHFNELFDLAFGVSGGTVPATMLMHGAWRGRETQVAKSTIAQAFPDYWDLLNMMDKGGERRRKFVTTLEPLFASLSFGKGNSNRFVYVGSHKGQPVFFCDPEIEFDSHELRCAEGTSSIDGIMASSSYTARLSTFGTMNFSVNLFKPTKLTIMPTMEQRTIVDGTHCFPKRDGRFVLDGASPTPLAIDYLKKLPGEHNVVVFDNGGPINSEFRKSIGLDERGVGRIVDGDVKINVFIIFVAVDYFALNALNKSQEYASYLENQVDHALAYRSRITFSLALAAVISTMSSSSEPHQASIETERKQGHLQVDAKL